MSAHSLTQEERETLEEMPLNQWFYAMPSKFNDFMKGLESKGFIESSPCSFNKSGFKWRRVKDLDTISSHEHHSTPPT